MDQSKKTMRHFYCRDVLWETFEQMANDFDCSIDYLINEAMRYYARSKNYQSAMSSGAGPGSGPPPGSPTSQHPSQPGPGRRTLPPPPPQQPGPPMAAHQMPMAPPMQQPMSPPPMSPPPMVTAPMQAQPMPPPGPSLTSSSGNMARRPAPPGNRQAPTPGSQPPFAAAGAMPTLFLVFNNQKYAIQKDQFIIGRGSKTSDLAIKDGNISRKHAAVIRRNGTYYIKDLGSTNGIDYKGMRIDNKRIDEGDIFHLCDYEIRFTYREQ